MIKERVEKEYTVIPGHELIGRKCKVKQITQTNTFKWGPNDGNNEFEISEILFRVSLDGKTITIVHLKGREELDFTLKDLVIL